MDGFYLKVKYDYICKQSNSFCLIKLHYTLILPLSSPINFHSIAQIFIQTN